jgi:hypothetical protein
LSLWVVLAFALWSAVEYYQTFTAVLTGRAPAPASSQPSDDSVSSSVTPGAPTPVVNHDSRTSAPAAASAATVGRINGHAVADPAASRNYPRPAPRRS